MNNADAFALILGFISPPLIAILQQPTWSSATRAILTFVWCCIGGIGTVYFTGALTGANVVSATLLVLVTAIATYKGLWQPTGIAPAIEKATSPK